MSRPEPVEPPRLVPVRARAAGSQPEAVDAALSNAVEHLTYVSHSLDSAADSMLVEVQLGCLESIIKDLVDPAIQALIRLRAELKTSPETAPS